MRAVVSGQARVALLWEGDRLSSLHSRTASQPVERSPRDIPYLLGEAKDLRFLDGVDEERAAEALARAVDEEDALHLTLLLLDPTLRPETRREASLDLEILLAEPANRGFLERIFWSRPLPREADLPGALAQKAGTTSAVGDFLRRLEALQMTIAEVLAAWHAIPDQTLEPHGRAALQTAAVEAGIFRDLVLACREGDSFDRFFEHNLLQPHLKRLTNLGDFLTAWLRPLREPRTPFAYPIAEPRRLEQVAEKPEAGDVGRLRGIEPRTSLPIEHAAEPERIRILFLSANPPAPMRLRLDQEVREIDLALREGEHRDRFDLVSQWAVRLSDLRSCLLRHRPHIVHWRGHGGESEGIYLEGDDGSPHLVEAAPLAQIFKLAPKGLRCVVLNACYSAPQAGAIAEAVDCVVAMPSEVNDPAASRFASAFYQALARGRDVRAAVEVGKVEINLAQLGGPQEPRLIATRCDPESVGFAESLSTARSQPPRSR